MFFKKKNSKGTRCLLWQTTCRLPWQMTCRLLTHAPSTNVVAKKSDIHFFYQNKPFFNLFQPQTPYKYLYNTSKPTSQPIKLKKQSKPLNHTEKKYFILDLDLLFFSFATLRLKTIIIKLFSPNETR